MKVRICIDPNITIDEIEVSPRSGQELTDICWERAEEWLSDHWYMEVVAENAKVA